MNIKRLTQLTLVLCFIVIVYGAYTRLKDAGLGCPDWPGCYGTLTVPSNEELALERFPEAPFDASKAWIEVTHRMLAGTLGLLIFTLCGINIHNSVRGRLPAGSPGRGGSLSGGIAIASKSTARVKTKLSKVLLLCGFVVICQALLGMLTVSLKLVPFVVTAHLAGGLMTFSLLFLYLQSISDNGISPPDTNKTAAMLKWAYLGLFLIISQILMGGWVSTNYAALACTDFPLCNGEIVPTDAEFAGAFDILQPIGPNYEGGLMSYENQLAIHWLHRVGALLVVLFWISFYAALYFYKVGRSRDETSIVLLLLAVQVTLGITNVLGDLPLLVATMHNGVAALLLLSAISVVFRLHHSQSLNHSIAMPKVTA